MLKKSDVKISRELKAEFREDGPLQAESSGSGMLVVLNVVRDDDLMKEGVARELINRIQKLRKKVHLRPEDRVEIFVASMDDELLKVLNEKVDVFREVLHGSLPMAMSERADNGVVYAEEDVEAIGDSDVKLCLTALRLCPSLERITALVNGDSTTGQAICEFVRSRRAESLEWKVNGSSAQKSTVVHFGGDKGLDTYELLWDVHVFASTFERVSAGAPP